jgi:DNA-binding FadR family transcriptional regulator
VHDAGDHIILIGKVENFRHSRTDSPLVFADGAYKMITQSLHEFVVKVQVSHMAFDEAYVQLYQVLARLAADRAEAKDIDRIEEAIAHIEACTPETARAAEGVAEFFAAIASAAHNEVLSVVIDCLTTIMRYRMMSGGPLVLGETLKGLNQAILQGIRIKDADAAAQAIGTYFAVLRSIQLSQLA